MPEDIKQYIEEIGPKNEFENILREMENKRLAQKLLEQWSKVKGRMDQLEPLYDETRLKEKVEVKEEFIGLTQEEIDRIQEEFKTKFITESEED